jgi:multiple sugar transport system substrate-binding protein
MKPITVAKMLAAATAFAIGLAAPVRAETVLSGYHTYAAHDPWQNELVKRFKAVRPDIDITYRASAPSYEDGLLTIARQSLTGQEPDFHLGGMQLLRAFVARKMIEPFDDLLVGKDLAAMGYSKEILAEGQLGGHQYALPWGVSTPVVFVNTDLVRKAGGDPDKVAKNWDELIAVAGKISKMGPDMMGMYWETGTDDWMTQNLFLNNAAPLLSADERGVGFDNDKGLAALAMYQRFFKEGGQKPIELQAARQTFFAGKMGFYMTTTAAIRSFRTESGNRFTLQTAALPLMSPDATISSAGMVAFITTKDPAKRRAALDFILFGTNAESQAWVVLNTGYMPSNTGALRADLLGDFYRDNPAFYTSVTQLPRARAWLGWPGENGVKISGVVRDYMTALSNGQAEPKATLDGMARDINALLPKK